MSTPETHTQSLEEIQAQILDTLTVGHEQLDKEHDRVKSDVNEVIEFLAHDGDYVYSLDNQKEFYRVVNNLASALAVVDVVVADDRMKSYLAQNNVPQPEQGMIQDISDKITKKKHEPRKTDIYEDSVIEFHKKLKKKDIVKSLIHHYTHAMEDKKILRDLDDDEYHDAMNDLVAIHRTIMPDDMGYPIIQIHRQYIEMRKDAERKDVLSLGISHQRDLYREKEQQKFMG
jgi:hypothetical protein